MRIKRGATVVTVYGHEPDYLGVVAWLARRVPLARVVDAQTCAEVGAQAVFASDDDPTLRAFRSEFGEGAAGA